MKDLSSRTQKAQFKENLITNTMMIFLKWRSLPILSGLNPQNVIVVLNSIKIPKTSNIVNFAPKATVETADIKLNSFQKVKLKKKEKFAKSAIENS